MKLAILIPAFLCFIISLPHTYAAPLGQTDETLPPSPAAAMESILTKSREALEKAKVLDEQRKAAWIESQQALRQARKLTEHYKQSAETVWSSRSQGYEELENLLKKEEESAKLANQLEKQANQRQTYYRLHIKKLLKEAETAEKNAQIIYQAWVEVHGKQLVDEAQHYRTLLDHANEINKLRLLEAQKNLENVKNSLKNAEGEFEHLQRVEKERSETIDREVKALNQNWQEEEQAESLWSSATTSHEELLDTLTSRDNHKNRALAFSRRQSTIATVSKKKLEDLSAKVENLKNEVAAEEDRLKRLTSQSEAMIEQTQAQSRRADSLARLADTTWPDGTTAPGYGNVNEVHKPEPQVHSD